MMKFCLCNILFVLVVVTQSYGQNQSIDYQCRLLVHSQAIDSGKVIGFAGWGIIPNILQKGPLRFLFVGGPFFKGKNSEWCEVMGGVFIGMEGAVKPVFDARALMKPGRVVLYGEIFYSPKEGKLLISENVALPFSGTSFLIGIESDTWLIHGKRPFFSIGPRAVTSLNIFKGASIAFGYQFTNDTKDILRAYMLFTI